MKQILLIISVAILTILSSCEPQDKKITHYLNEDFLILETRELLKADNVVKIWLIERLNSSPDTLLCAEITSLPTTTEFKITDEFWYKKSVGDTLHLDFIKKDRFFRAIEKPESVQSQANVINNWFGDIFLINSNDSLARQIILILENLK